MNPRIEKTLDGTEIVYTEFPPEEKKLVELFQELFLEHWREITFGPCMDGAVYEITLGDSPKSVDYKDGYLTIDTGKWHCHLCLGRPKTSSEELAKRRQTARVAFFESKNKSCVPMSFGLRMWNGAGDQMISVFFPNPYLSTGMKAQKPDWSRLELWKKMKLKYTGDASPCLASVESAS